MTPERNISQRSVALLSWMIFAVLNFFQLLYVKLSGVNEYSWQDMFLYPVTSLTIGVLLIYLWLLPGFGKIRTLRVGVQVPLFVVHGFIYSSVYIVLLFFQISLWSDSLPLSALPEEVQRFFYTDFHNIAKNYFFLLAIYIAVEYINKRQAVLMKQTELEHQLKETKLQALESKLHPHFLFNSLNGIAALIKENPPKAQQAVVELSDLLRFSLEADMQQPIALHEELILLDKYMSIERMRYEEQLSVDVTVDDAVELNKAVIPPMILQPLLENAIVHGFKGKEGSLKVSILVDADKISIRNNGKRLSGNPVFGTGLRIVDQRLKYHFGDEVKLRLYQDGDEVVCEINGLEL